MKLFSHAERPELLSSGAASSARPGTSSCTTTPVANLHWDRQYEEFPDLQLYLVDDEDRYLAESNAVPIPFGPDALPDDGWDAAMEQAFAGRAARRPSRRSRSRSASTSAAAASAR